jgi:hypothetical protein
MYLKYLTPCPKAMLMAYGVEQKYFWKPDWYCSPKERESASKRLGLPSGSGSPICCFMI